MRPPVTPQPPYQFKSLAKGIGFGGFQRKKSHLPSQALQSLRQEVAPSALLEQRQTRLYSWLFKLSQAWNALHEPKFLRTFNLLRILAIDLIIVLLFIGATLISASILVRALYHKDSLLVAIKALPSFWEELSFGWMAIPVLAGVLGFYIIIMRLVAGRTLGEILFPEVTPLPLRRHS